MITIRKARDADKPQVIRILKDTDIYYSALKFEDFWVAEEEGEILGCAQLEEYPAFYYLGSLGVAVEHEGKGIARMLLNPLLKRLKKDTYIYTIIPEFFKKFDFVVAPPLPDLPSKDRYECADCHPERCVTMVRHAKKG